jgi:hypothetical protein
VIYINHNFQKYLDDELQHKYKWSKKTKINVMMLLVQKRLKTQDLNNFVIQDQEVAFILLTQRAKNSSLK